jgi:Co/Zn/Cd efflux system component
MFNAIAAVLFAFATYGWQRYSVFDACLKVAFLIATVWAVINVAVDMGYMVRVH